MVLDILHNAFWGSRAGAAGTGLLCAIAFCLWVMDLSRTSISRLFRRQSTEEARGQAAQITAANLQIIAALLLGTNGLLAGILCALLFGSTS